jgi:FSR family fosmidomycin resistance protein-like MFS transporter
MRVSSIVFLGLAHAINHSFLLAIPVLLPQIANSLNIGIYDMGYVTSLAYFLYGFGSIFVGPLSRRFSSRRLVFLSLLFSGLSLVPLLLYVNVYVFTLSLALNSFFASIYHPIANKLISEDYYGSVGRVMGLHGLGGSLGSVAVPMLSIAISQIFDWRTSLILLGFLSMFLSIAFITGGSKPIRIEADGSKIKFPYDRVKWILVFSIFIGLFSRGFELFLPSLLISRGVDQFYAAMAMSLLLLTGVFGQLFGGFFADVKGSLKALFLSFVLVPISLIFIVFGRWSIYMSLFGVILYGFSFYAHQPPSTKIQSELVDSSLIGYVYGLFFCINFSLGSVSSSLTGFLAGVYGLEAAYVFLTALTVLSLLTVIIMYAKYSKLLMEKRYM